MSRYRGIKNIVFDLGVVLFDLDYQLSIQAFERIGVQNHEKLFSEAGQAKLFDKFERGEIGINEFVHGMKAFIPGDIEDEAIIGAWNAMLLGFPQSSVDLLKTIDSHYNLYLLSNTNDLHFKRFHEMLDEQHGLKGLDGFFSAIYYSHQEGLRKPEAAIYSRLLEKEGLEPSETVFVDDMIKNIEGAESVGLLGCWLEKGRSVTDLFDDQYVFQG